MKTPVSDRVVMETIRGTRTIMKMKNEEGEMRTVAILTREAGGKYHVAFFGMNRYENGTGEEYEFTAPGFYAAQIMVEALLTIGAFLIDE